MNAMPHHQSRPDAVTGRSEALSALIDARAEPAELEQLMAGLDAELADTVQRYELIGDVLRGGRAAVRPASDTRRLLDRIHAGLGDDALRTQPEAPLRPAVAVVATRPAAANDSVFRWKLVAGLASVAAVMAVSWNLLGAGAPGVPPAATAPLLVQGPAAGTTDTDPPEAVLVMTPQGAVVRDPQLEQLLNEHRQFGGMTALQAPTGFLRNATFDAEGR